LLEYKRPNIANVVLDYAIVELGPNSAEQLPVQQYASVTIDVAQATLANAQMLTIIQHPNGDPKRIAAGRHLRADATAIYYSDVDTMQGSSGAGVLDQTGHLIGVHTSGGCDDPDLNFENSGVTLNAVSQVSDLIR
jgi:V8-like Glu-specific endopeptidase